MDIRLTNYVVWAIRALLLLVLGACVQAQQKAVIYVEQPV